MGERLVSPGREHSVRSLPRARREVRERLRRIRIGRRRGKQSIEEIKNRLDALLAERKKKNNRKRIVSATIWTMFAAAALFVLFSLSVLGLPELAILNEPTRGSSVAFGINTGADVLLLLGIILAIVIIGVAAGLICWAKIRKEERNGKDHK